MSHYALANSENKRIPSKHAGSDPEAFYLRPVMAVTASVQPELGRIVYASSSFPYPIQVCVLFPKEGMDHIVQYQPGSDLHGLVRVWPNASGLEASRCTGIIGPGFWQDATGPLPVSHFQTGLRSCTDGPNHVVLNQPGSDLVLDDCVRFWPNGSGPEASRCERIIRPASGQRFRADPDRICESDPACLLGEIPRCRKSRKAARRGMCLSLSRRRDDHRKLGTVPSNSKHWRTTSFLQPLS